MAKDNAQLRRGKRSKGKALQDRISANNRIRNQYEPRASTASNRLLVNWLGANHCEEVAQAWKGVGIDWS